MTKGPDPMTNPDELERAVERLEEILPRLDVCAGYAAHFGTPRAMQEGVKPRDVYWNDHFAADLRLILSANREMREALLNIDACSQHSYGFSDFSMRRRCGQIARSALTTHKGGE